MKRRTLLAGIGGLGAVIGASAGGLVAWEATSGEASSEPKSVPVPFRGEHQAGIATSPQRFLHFAAFDIVSTNRADVVSLLQRWTAAADRLSLGQTSADLSDNLLAPPEDTGEALGLPSASLTITFGFGPGLFTRDGVDRFGLASARPAALADIPPFKNDDLEPARSGGDLCVQACADDPQVAFHAVRSLARIGRGTVVMRWSQLGFSKTSSDSRTQDTPRNLMGFKDGTHNITTEDAADMATNVWVGDEGPPWMRGGSYLTARRIRMRIETWDRSSLQDQQDTIGRLKVSGAPIGKSAEFDPPDFEITNGKGEPLIPVDSHVRRAHAISNNGARILRRGYSFTDGMDSFGQLDAGLFFIAYQRDPRAQFFVIQGTLAEADTLNEYISHTGSAIFACPRGMAPNEWCGQDLFS